MHPILFSLGSFQLRSYGVLAALGFGLAVWLSTREAKAKGISAEKFMDLTLWTMLGGIVGARLLYVLVSWREFSPHPWDAVKIWEGGLVFYGGLVLGGLAAFWQIHRQGWEFRKISDLLIPYLALGHAVGRVGCFLNGCCYGLPVQRGALGVVIPALGDQTGHFPIQLVESIYNLALFLFLQRLKSSAKFQGKIIWVYGAFYGLGRFILEFFRGDEIRGTLLVPWLHTSQLISLLLVALSLGMIFRTRTRSAM